MFTVAEKLPDFWQLAQTTAGGLRAGRIADWDALSRHIRPLLEPDVVERMEQAVPGWRQIATLHGGETALHTLLVLAACLNLPEYTLGDEQTCREIEWAAVLHDLDKQQTRRDAAHPLRSAAVAACSLPGLGFELQPNLTTADLEAWAELVMAAQRPLGNPAASPDPPQMVPDHSHLKEIISGLHACWGAGTPAARVLKAVLFHQSLPTLNDWPGPVLLSDAQLAFALSLEDMQVLGPLMLGDSDSWNLFSDRRTAYLFELRANNAETRRRIAAAGQPGGEFLADSRSKA